MVKICLSSGWDSAPDLAPIDGGDADLIWSLFLQLLIISQINRRSWWMSLVDECALRERPRNFQTVKILPAAAPER